MQDLQDQIREELAESAALKAHIGDTMAGEIEVFAKAVTECLRSGGLVAFCGNGGSAADAQHLAGELVGRYRLNRPAFRSLALTTDTSILTAIGNDFGFDQVFARQVEGLLGPGDLLIAISTSGNAENCVNAVNLAKERGAGTIAMTGKSGGALGDLCDLCIKVPHDLTPRIQECHITIGHIVCGLVERALTQEQA